MLELVCRVYNINKGHNKELLERCKWLSDYMTFVDKVREFFETRKTKGPSPWHAVDLKENDKLWNFVEPTTVLDENCLLLVAAEAATLKYIRGN